MGGLRLPKQRDPPTPNSMCVDVRNNLAHLCGDLLSQSEEPTESQVLFIFTSVRLMDTWRTSIVFLTFPLTAVLTARVACCMCRAPAVGLKAAAQDSLAGMLTYLQLKLIPSDHINR